MQEFRPLDAAGDAAAQRPYHATRELCGRRFHARIAAVNDGLQSLTQSLDGNILIASLIWGSVGVAFTIYGKRQKEWVPLIGGLALVGISYFIGSALFMSLAGVALVAAIFGLRNRF